MHPEDTHTHVHGSNQLHSGDDDSSGSAPHVLQNFTELATHGNPFLYETCQHTHAGWSCLYRKGKSEGGTLVVRFQRLMGGHHSQEVTDALLQRLENITILIKLETSGRTLDLKEPLAS
jgi:hypothetical protein